MTLTSDPRERHVAAPPPSDRRTHSPIWKILTTTDHKTIGLMYLITSLTFFMFGGAHEQGKHAAEHEERERRDQVHQTDRLVVGRRQDLPDRAAGTPVAGQRRRDVALPRVRCECQFGPLPWCPGQKRAPPGARAALRRLWCHVAWSFYRADAAGEP